MLGMLFGANATDRMDYELTEIGAGVPLLVYNVSGTTVFAFRGFASGLELSMQIERLASLWVVPFILDLLPLYGPISDRYLSAATAYAQLLGWHWFTPRSPSDELVRKAAEIYEDMAIPSEAPVVFVGVNSGGTIAKRPALLKGRRGISVLAPPIDLDEFENRYDLEEDATQWITNIVNKEGLFSREDTGFAENFALIGDPGSVGNDQVYPSFCNLAEICGHSSQFGDYCRTAIGDEQLTAIKTYLHPPTA
jgi:hypothetical protein